MIQFMVLSFIIMVIESNILDRIENMPKDDKHSISEKENKSIDIDAIRILEEYGFINIKQ